MQLLASLAFLPLLGLTSTATPVPGTKRAEDTKTPAGCTDLSFGGNFAWTAKAFDFHASYIFSTPSHQNSWGYVSFDLVNPADQTTTHCEASSNQLSDFFYGNFQYKCNDTERLGKTTFDFNRPANLLRVNQTWRCDDKDPQWPITFTGRGQVAFNLTCTEEKYENPDWQMGEIYSSRTITCGKVNRTFKPTDIDAIA
ncbi:hypothetical protein MYCTH_2078150 [Thermothelomyces thermophilus ATCC 42464]|uniref:AA1-like domain-containing protein n=1 Tax=Thermothelomyces thermophilus (strain ATCC 42464 / BCRC 31852 / DSM 1799) TaxID=573729 RepID=G2QA29_THET4|nr:uncharacterized protein MYCTH_2078150 [Thermothelomyces thermophilus ATCC 42464]AEO56633.1 hypothetical protein MYCTH_2078150 [Thermothelomyces thermophilus ATCC 42464]